MEYAIDYAKRNGKLDGIDNVGVICEGVEDNEYTIRIYEDMEDHIVTIFQWSVCKDGGIYDVMLDEWIHKEN